MDNVRNACYFLFANYARLNGESINHPVNLTSYFSATRNVIHHWFFFLLERIYMHIYKSIIFIRTIDFKNVFFFFFFYSDWPAWLASHSSNVSNMGKHWNEITYVIIDRDTLRKVLNSYFSTNFKNVSSPSSP